MASGIARSGFDIDLLDGKAREDAFAYVLLKAKIEHKSDEACRKTGNVFIEFRQKGKPSGIAITEANWWAIEYNDNCWLVIPIERLKAIARQAFKAGKRKKGGDNNNYEGVLIPIEWLTRPFREVK